MIERTSRSRGAAWMFVLTALVAVAAFVIALDVDDAAAHSDQGLLALEAERAGDTAVRVTATLKYANDGDLVGGAAVTATASNDAGATTPPVTLTQAAPGVYRGQIDVTTAGAWTIAARSEQPTATASITVELTAAVTTTEVAPDDAQPADDQAGEDGPNLVVVWGPVVVIAALGALVAFVLRRRSRA